MTSICLATSYDASFRQIGDYAAMSCRLYARRFGHSVYVDDDLSCERHPAWHRVLLIPQLLDKGYDYVLWTDADALFTRFDRDVADVITGRHDLYMVQHDHPLFAPTKVPNTGVMLVRNSDWSRSLFARLWAMEKYANHIWWENAALIDLFGYHSLLGDRPNDFAQDELKHVLFLDEIWNHVPSIESERVDAVIRHYAGSTREERLGEMPRYAMAACFRAVGDLMVRDDTAIKSSRPLSKFYDWLKQRNPRTAAR